MLRLPLRAYPATAAKWLSRRLSSGETCLEEEQRAQWQPLFRDIHGCLASCPAGDGSHLVDVCTYYFDGQGKTLRPMVTLTMAAAANAHLWPQLQDSDDLLKTQRQISQICEMYHTASLMHDDVIDRAETRRGKVSMNRRFGQISSVFAATYTIAMANKVLSQLRKSEVMREMIASLSDLVLGELQQMSQVQKDPASRMGLYIDKSYNKTAALMAHSCGAVALLSAITAQSAHHARQDLVQRATGYGKNLGIAFQLIDDCLDYEASGQQLGKPGGGADLKLGLGTAPVLFAADQFPELNNLIRRKFSEPGDVEYALDKVLQSDGLHQTRDMAKDYLTAATACLSPWRTSPAKEALISLAGAVLHRKF